LLPRASHATTPQDDIDIISSAIQRAVTIGCRKPREIKPTFGIGLRAEKTLGPRRKTPDAGSRRLGRENLHRQRFSSGLGRRRDEGKAIHQFIN
jgi:hypothetical protein